MFGRLRRAREEKAENERKEAEAAAAREEISNIGLPSEEDTQGIQDRADEMAAQQREKEKQQREGNRADIEESVNRDFEGLSEEKKRALQETANTQIGQQAQRSNRQLQSEAGNRGFVGGDDALKMEVSRLASESAGQFSRDLAVMDSDAAMKKLETSLVMEEGRAAQDLLQDEYFLDYIRGLMDKDKEDEWTAYFAEHAL